MDWSSNLSINYAGSHSYHNIILTCLHCNVTWTCAMSKPLTQGPVKEILHLFKLYEKKKKTQHCGSSVQHISNISAINLMKFSIKVQGFLWFTTGNINNPPAWSTSIEKAIFVLFSGYFLPTYFHDSPSLIWSRLPVLPLFPQTISSQTFGIILSQSPASHPCK